MKYPIVILFLAALFAQSFSRSLVLADYMVNLEAYKEKCINKAKPKLNCNGKCQMYKKINQQDQSSEAEAPKLNQSEFVLSSKTYFPELQIALNASSVANHTIYKDVFTSNFIGSIFHPPGVLNA